MINCAVPSTEFLDRRFDVFVVTDLDALVEISVFKKRKKEKKKLTDAPHSNIMHHEQIYYPSVRKEPIGNRTTPRCSKRGAEGNQGSRA